MVVTYVLTIISTWWHTSLRLLVCGDIRPYDYWYVVTYVLTVIGMWWHTSLRLLVCGDIHPYGYWYVVTYVLTVIGMWWHVRFVIICSTNVANWLLAHARTHFMVCCFIPAIKTKLSGFSALPGLSELLNRFCLDFAFATSGHPWDLFPRTERFCSICLCDPYLGLLSLVGPIRSRTLAKPHMGWERSPSRPYFFG